MFKKFYLNLILLFTGTLLFVSCTVPIKSITTGPQNVASVPADFDPKHNILLVVAIPRLENAQLVDMKSTIKLDDEMRKHYPYQYKIVTQKEVYERTKNGDDSSNYRYALLSQRRVVVQKGSFELSVEEGLAYVPGYKATYLDFAFYDRITGRRFPYSGTSTTAIKLAVNNLIIMINRATEKKDVEQLKASSVMHQNPSKTDVSFWR